MDFVKGSLCLWSSCEMRLLLPPPEPRPHKTPELEEMVWAGLWAALQGAGVHSGGTEASMTGKDMSSAAQEGKAWCKQPR